MPAASNSITITFRDLLILDMIYSYNTCSIDHVSAKYFPHNPNGRKTACYKRVGELREAGCISWERCGASSGVGSGKALLSLPAKGRALLAEEYLNVPPATLKPLKHTSSSYGRDHHLAICDVRLATELAYQSYPSLYLEWENERELRSTPIRAKDQTAAIKPLSFFPDGKFISALPNREPQTFYLEMEMDPLRRPKIVRAKLVGYFQIIGSLQSAKPFILWVVPTPKAQAVLASWVQDLAKALGFDPSIFWITTRDAIDSHSILSPIWQVVGVGTPQSLIPLSLLSSELPSVHALTDRSSAMQYEPVSQ